MSYPPQQSPNHEELYETLREWQKSTFLQPDVALNISVGEPISGVLKPQNFIVDPFVIDGLLDCRNVSITSNGIVIAPVDDEPKEFENNGTKEVPAFGSLVFPKMPGVDIVPFHFAETGVADVIKDLRSQCESLDDVSFDKAVIRRLLNGKLDGKESDIKCAVFMTNVLDFAMSSLLIQAIGRVTKRQVAVGGCIGNLSRDSGSSEFQTLEAMLQCMNEYEEDRPNQYAQTAGLVFAGANVIAASVLLSSQIHTQSKVEAELKRLKECKDFDEKAVAAGRSVGLMFACCGRGRRFYKGKANVESTVFRKLFPTTPLLGIFGNGEIGLTYIPSEKNSEESNGHGENGSPVEPNCKKPRTEADRERRWEVRDFSHSFTTVFIMLTFK